MKVSVIVPTYVTVGQYLQPSRGHLPVQRYCRPGEFESLRLFALRLGFRDVVAGPLVRSSYRAAHYGSALGRDER